jgi:hypothetical protein
MYLTKHRAMKTYGGRDESMVPPFLTLALDGVKWLASHSGRFIPGERASGTHFIGGWVGPRAGLDIVEKSRTSTGISNPFFQPIAEQTAIS